MLSRSLGLVAAGGLMIGIATLAGAWLGRRNARRDLCLAAAAGALLVIALVHLLPDAWSAASQAGMTWVVPLAAAASFGAAGLVVRRGCACQAECEAAGGAGTAGALAVHRLLEGVVLAIGGSVVVAVALFVHAFAEGLAAGALLRSVTRRRAALFLAVMCLSPIAGASIADLGSFPAQAEPVLLALAAGVLGQAARVSFSAAFRDLRVSRLVTSSPAAATIVAMIVTSLAVRVVG